MKTCEQCYKEYDETNVNIPNPIPDRMCHNCGTQLTEEEVSTLIKEFQTSMSSSK
jgi:NMD protein affecting ribosome stability and mRNA decay